MTLGGGSAISGKSKRILLLEDESDLKYSLEFVLTLAGYSVDTAQDGLQARDLLRKSFQPYDLLITDIQVPGMTGLELLDEIKELGIELPVLTITGFGDKEMVVELLRRGCSEYLDKPFKPAELVDIVGKVIARADKRKRAAREPRRLSQREESYKAGYESIKSQIDSAVTVFTGLIGTGRLQVCVPMEHRMKSLSALGGDFFDARDTDVGCDIMVADVAGHDMAASYHAIALKALFDEIYRSAEKDSGGGRRRPLKTAQEQFVYANRQLLSDGLPERMVTALHLRLDLRNMRAEVVSAGHPPVLVINRRRKSIRQIEATGAPLGIKSEVSYRSVVFELEPGDVLALFTDGVLNIQRIDGRTGAKSKLSLEGVERLLARHMRLPIAQMLTEVWNSILKYCRHNIQDDMLMALLEIPNGDSRYV